MKNLLFVILFSLPAMLVHASEPPPQPCAEAQFFCSSDAEFSYAYEGCDTAEIWLYFSVPSTLDLLNIMCADSMYSYTIWGPYEFALGSACSVLTDDPAIEYTRTQTTISYNVITDVGNLSAGFYYLRIKAKDCSSTIGINTREDLSCYENSCEYCIGSFAPDPGRKYVITAWTKEHGAAATKTSYTFPRIYIIFPDITDTLGPFSPSGQIIDGWQRLEATFTIPLTATLMQIKLECTNGDCYFDDIRVHPFDGSMKTYVYDPVTLRLVAELDERNYATYYEYDEEGKLLRVKKETERGVMTIQESKTSIKKNG
jgi:hypothetical protein